jgi:hypothetical protein
MESTLSFVKTLQDDVKSAMKLKDKLRLSTLRMLISDLKLLEKKNQSSLSKDQELSLLTQHVKRRRESINAFEEGGRKDLADKEREELLILSAYLPEQLSPEAVKEMVQKIISETGASNMKDMGRVMGKLMPQIKGKFPGKEVKPIVENLLQE